MLLPVTDSKIVARRADIVAALEAIVPGGVVADKSGLATFDSDALSAYHQMPLVCVLPADRQQVSEVLKYAAAEGIPSGRYSGSRESMLVSGLRRLLRSFMRHALTVI